MGKGEWIALLAIATTTLMAAIAGFIANESRISKLEAQDEDQKRRMLIIVEKAIQQNADIAHLQGMHEGHGPITHRETTQHAEQ